MPSYTIHIAVALRYLETAAGEDRTEFIRGVIAPDLLKKPESHYGPYSSQPGPEQYVKECGLGTSYNRGYYLHLLTDKLFYSEYLTEFSPEIYNDYDRLNARLVERYGIEIPDEIKDTVCYAEGEPVILDEGIFGFIEKTAQTALKDKQLKQ